MGSKRRSFLKVILGGMLVFAAVPPAIYWTIDHAYAASGAAVSSVADIRGKLAPAMMKRSTKVVFTFSGRVSTLKSKMRDALKQAIESDPYLNYTVENYTYTYRGTANSATVTVMIKYRETAQQTEWVTRKSKEILGKIIRPGMTSHEKVKVIHDWVVLNLKYDRTLSRYTAYEGLTTGSAVCQGYSLLTYRLLEGAGIKNLIVEGTARSGGVSQSHAWNLVQLDGRWYHLDTTWDDPTPDRAGEVSIDYYMRTDAQMRRDHSWVKSYPAATVSYQKTLAALAASGGAKAEAYSSLYKALRYNLLDETNIVSDGPGIRLAVEQAMGAGKSSATIRYRGGKAKLNRDLDVLSELGISSLDYTMAPFENTTDLTVVLNWG